MKKVLKLNLNRHKKRFICTFIGSIIYLNSIMGLLGIGQYSVYITSYFHHYDEKINIQSGNLMSPILMLFLSLSSPLGGIFEHKLGMHLTLIICSILIELLIFIFILLKNIYITFAILILLGICIGTCSTLPRKNICLYYPEKKGILMGLMTSCLILFIANINVIGEKIINPNKIILKEGETYYPLDIAKNYIKFYKLMLIIIPIGTILSLLLIKKYDPSIKYNDQIEKLDKSNISNQNNKKDENYSKNIKAAIINSRIWRLAAVLIFTNFTIDFALSTFRVYGALISINGSVMQYSPLFIALSNIIFGPLWGYIIDKLQNFKLMRLVCIVFLIDSIIISIFIQSNIIYMTCLMVGMIFNGGLHSTIHPHIMRIYGMKYYIEIGGVISITTGIFSILKAGLSFLISFYYHTGKELQKPYRITYIVGTGLNILAFYLATKEKEQPFIYPNSLNNEIFNNTEISNNEKINHLSQNEVKIEGNLKI